MSEPARVLYRSLEAVFECAVGSLQHQFIGIVLAASPALHMSNPLGSEIELLGRCDNR